MPIKDIDEDSDFSEKCRENDKNRGKEKKVKGKRKNLKKSQQYEEDDSVDSKGNIRNLIDYEYSDKSSVSEVSEKPSPRKAKQIAKKKLRKIANLLKSQINIFSEERTLFVALKNLRKQFFQWAEIF